MRFLELMERVRGRGVEVVEVRAGGDEGGPEILGVCEDSRKVRAGDLFVARGGTKVDGGKFIGEAVARGAVAVVLVNAKGKTQNAKEETGHSKLETRNLEGGVGNWELGIGNLGGVAVAVVGDVNLACALLAHEVAGRPTEGMTMIGVTGTKGKTTVAYLMRSVLKAARFRVGMIGTVEIDYGGPARGGGSGPGGSGTADEGVGTIVVPAEMTTPGAVELVGMLARMRDNGVTHCVMEVSSHALHQRRVAGIEWKVGIFTNLTGDHLDYHGTMENYAAAKAMLFEGMGEGAVAVVNGDDEWAAKVVERTRANVVPYRIVGARRQAKGLDARWTGAIEEMTSDRMELTVGCPEGIEHVDTMLVGEHNAYNLVSVIVAAHAIGIGYTQTCAAVQQCRGAPGRLQRVPTEEGFNVFVDYAHTHDALENVLTALRATMGAGTGGPSAGGMLLTQSGEGEGGQVGQGRGVGKDPSRRQKHGTRDGGDAVRPAEGGAPNSAPDGDIGGTPMPRLICVFGCGGDRDRTKRPKMGAVAERLADVVVVTSDNPRTESAAAIIEEICAGFSEGWKTAGKISIEPDRRTAIKLAIGMAREGDVVLLAGKGHENYQIVGTVKHHFDDVEAAEAALRDKLATNEHE